MARLRSTHDLDARRCSPSTKLLWQFTMRTRAQSESEGAVSLDVPSQGTRQKRRVSSFTPEQDESMGRAENREHQSLQPKAKRQRKSKQGPNQSHAEEFAEDIALRDSRTDTEAHASSSDFARTPLSKRVRFSAQEAPLTNQLTTPAAASNKETGVFRYLKTFTGLLTPDSNVKSVQANCSQATSQATPTTSKHVVGEVSPSPINALLSNHQEEAAALLRSQHHAVLLRFGELEARNERLEQIELRLDIELDKRAHTILALEAEVNELQEAAAASTESIKAQEATISTLSAANRGKEMSIDRLQSALDMSSRDLASTKDLLEQTQSLLDDASAKLQAENKKLDELVECLNGREASIADLKVQVKEAGQEANEVRMKLFELQEQRKQDEEQREQELGRVKKTCNDEVAKSKEVVEAKHQEVDRLTALVQTLKGNHEAALRDWYNIHKD